MERLLRKSFESWLFKEKIILLFGARQVGKTTLSKALLRKYGAERNYYLCEDPAVKEVLATENPSLIKNFLGDAKLVVFDEAQYLENIGRILKLLHDSYPTLQIIATGSSSFDLANKINEPLTGRAIQFMLYPLSLQEFQAGLNRTEIKSRLQQWLVYGLYPGLLNENVENMQVLLRNLAEQYLYKDLLLFEKLNSADKIIKLLKLLALQLGSDVSIHELAGQLSVSRSVVERYLDLLQKMFIVVKVGSFSRNLRKELSKKAKYYFCDVGIRNALLNHFADLALRSDVGALWENFCVIERIKYWANQNRRVQGYFWRTHDQKEIDYIEEYDGTLYGFEFKWQQPRKLHFPEIFQQTYPNSTLKLISPFNLFALFT